MIIQHGGKQVVRRADGMEIPREVQVDVLHGDDLRISAAGGAALDAEHGSERGLPQGDHGILSDPAKPVGKTDRRRRFPLPCRGRGHRGHENEFPSPERHAVHGREADLRLISAVRLQYIFRDMRRFRHLGDGVHLTRLCNLNIRFLCHIGPSRRIRASCARDF